MPGIIGLNTIGANVNLPSFNAYSTIYPPLLYTAVSGDIAVDINWYGIANIGHGITMAIYDTTAGIPVNRLAPATSFPDATYSLGWHSLPINQPLVTGTIYTLAISFVQQISLYDDITGLDSTSLLTAWVLPAVWSDVSHSARTRSFYATIVGSTPPTPKIFYPCKAQLIT